MPAVAMGEKGQKKFITPGKKLDPEPVPVRMDNVKGKHVHNINGHVPKAQQILKSKYIFIPLKTALLISGGYKM